MKIGTEQHPESESLTPVLRALGSMKVGTVEHAERENFTPVIISSYTMKLAGVKTTWTGIRHTVITVGDWSYEVVGNAARGYKLVRNDQLRRYCDIERLVRVEGLDPEMETTLRRELEGDAELPVEQLQFKWGRDGDDNTRVLDLTLKSTSRAEHLDVVLKRLHQLTAGAAPPIAAKISTGREIELGMRARHGRRELKKCFKIGVPPAISAEFKLVRAYIVGYVDTARVHEVGPAVRAMLGQYEYHFFKNSCVHGSLHVYHALESNGVFAVKDKKGYEQLLRTNYGFTRRGRGQDYTKAIPANSSICRDADSDSNTNNESRGSLDGYFNVEIAASRG